MTVKELREQLSNLPDDYQVFVSERITEFSYGLVNSVYVKEINMSEEPDGEVVCREKVVIIDEE